MTRSTLLLRSVLGGLIVVLTGMPVAHAADGGVAARPAHVHCTITGTNGPDRIVGTPGDDVICARGGDDVIFGGGGDDLIFGGDGDDVIHGGPGNDRLFGGKGDDRLYGGSGDDRLNGGKGEDRLDGRDGDGSTDILRCDRGGHDVALADARDIAYPTCEQVRRTPAPPVPPTPPVTPTPVPVPVHVNAAPVAEAKSVTGVAENATASIDLAGSDADGDALTFHATQPAHGSIDTTAPTASCVTGTPSSCTAAVVYTPDADFSGSDSFTYTVDDGTATSPSATVAITVDPVNHAPVATDGQVSGPQDTDLSVDLGALVSDVETSEADLTYTIVGGPAHGTLSGTGSALTYTPTAGYSGQDSFTYSVTDRGAPDGCTGGAPACDGAKTSETRTFSITVLPAGCFLDDAQSDFQAGTVSGCDTATDPGSVQLAAIVPVLDQSNTTLGTSGVGITTTTWGGQTFTPSTTGALTQVDVNLFCSGCTGATPNLTVSIRATSGGLPTGADLATGTITGFSSGSSDFHTATFATPYTVTAGTQYAFVVRPTTNPSPGTYALTRSGTATAGSDVYDGGARVAGATGGTVWSIPVTGGVSTDAGFRAYVQAGTGFSAAGTFTSVQKDAAPTTGLRPMWSALTFDADTPTGTAVRFQVAASNSETGPFTFVGPDGTPDTYFTTSGASLSQFDGLRYLEYRAYLSTTDGAVTPTLRSVSICYEDVRAPV